MSTTRGSLGLASIVAVSARTPIGLSAAQTALCLRARKLEPRTCDVHDKRGRLIGTCRVGGLGELEGFERMLALAAGALSDLRPSAGGLALPLVVALPEAGRPDDEPGVATSFVHDLASRSGVAVDERRSRLVRAGHAGGAYALEQAVALLSECEQVLVGGVDSYQHPDVLRWLDEECRLHALDAEDGFIPGEGAAFCLLRRASEPGIARLTHLGTAVEESAGSDDPDLAVAMSALLRAAIVGRPCRWTIHDVNGERHRRRAWMLAEARGSFDEAAAFTALPADLGDLGAASGAVALSIAAAMWRCHGAPADHCLVALHAESGERGVFVMESSC